MARQPISSEKSSVFVDSIWEVPRILNSNRVKFHAKLTALPALGYRVYDIIPESVDLRTRGSIAVNDTTLENEYLRASVNPNGTIDLLCKETGKVYEGVNYLTSEGECGNAWKHVAPAFDRKYSSVGANAVICVKESGPLVGSIGVSYDFEVPANYGDGTGRSETLVKIPVRIEYRLQHGSPRLEVTVQLDNTAKDHWLRVNFPTHLDAKFSTADTHFDVISRPVELPDSTGWVEEAFGTHPLQTFACLENGGETFAVLPQGLFEFEAREDDASTLSLTLLRACRIKLAVSEEKLTELPDEGIQCPGRQVFRYALVAASGDWRSNLLLRQADEAAHPVRAIMTGRGKGSLPGEHSLFCIANPAVHVSAVKQAEDGSGLIVRIFNPTTEAQDVPVTFGKAVAAAERCGMDESLLEPLPVDGDHVKLTIAPKKIFTLRVR